MRLYFAIVSLFALPTAALASAKYAWVPEDPSSCCRGVLELSDEAFVAGAASWTPGFPDEGMPVERFHFDGRFKVSDLHPATVTAGAEKDVELVVRFAAAPETTTLCCAWDFQLKVDGEGLSGRLRVTTENDDIIMVGTEKGWSIARAGSDALASGVICGVGEPSTCIGGRGRWVLISAPAQATNASGTGSGRVPKPSSFHLR